LDLLNALLFGAWQIGAFEWVDVAPAVLGPTASMIGIEMRLPPVLAPTWRPGGGQLELQLGSASLLVWQEDGGEPERYQLGARFAATATFEGDALRLLFTEPRVEVLANRTGGAASFEASDISAGFVLGIWPTIEDLVHRASRVGFGMVPLDPAGLLEHTPGLDDIRMESIIEGPGRLIGHHLTWDGRVRFVLERADAVQPADL
jgi:hypothetical protein